MPKHRRRVKKTRRRACVRISYALITASVIIGLILFLNNPLISIEPLNLNIFGK